MADWALVRTSDGVVLSRQSGPPPSAAPPAGQARRFLATAQEQTDFSALFDQALDEGRDLVLSGHSPGNTSLTHDFPEITVGAGGEVFRKVLRITADYASLVGGTFALAADARPIFRVNVDAAHQVGGDPLHGQVVANGTDAITLTISRVNGGGAVQTGFAGTFRQLIHGRRVRLVFTLGVAKPTFRTTETGTLTIRSNRDYRVEAPCVIEADD